MRFFQNYQARGKQKEMNLLWEKNIRLLLQMGTPGEIREIKFTYFSRVYMQSRL